MHTRLAIAVLLSIAAVAAAPSALALDELSATAEGSGGVVRSGEALARVNQAQLSLKVDGEFIISFEGEGKFQFRGRWSQASDDRISLELTQAFGASASGQGVLMLQGGRAARVGLSGSNGAFSASFSAAGRYTDFAHPANSVESSGQPLPPGRSRDNPDERIDAPRPAHAAQAPAAPAAGPLRVTVQGEGTFTVVAAEGTERHFDAMEVFLDGDGSVHLKMFGPGFSAVLEGSWAKTGPGPGDTTRYRLTFRGGFGAGKTAGSGTLLVKDQRVVSLGASGSASALHSDWRLEFRQR